MITNFSKYNESKTSYDSYLANKEFMEFFKKVKKRILELFPTQNISNIDLLIDKIYMYYNENNNVEDVVNKLYMGGDLYKFTANGIL